jgi:hypothetical protein
VFFLLDLIDDQLFVKSSCEVALYGQVLLEFAQLVHALKGALYDSLFLQYMLVHILFPLENELVVVLMNVVPLLVDGPLPERAQFNSDPAVKNLIIYLFMVLCNYSIQLFIAVLLQKGTRRLRPITLIRVLLLLRVHEV